MCEALEGLAGLTAAGHDFTGAIRLLEIAQRERASHNLPLRAPDRRSLDDLRRMAERSAVAEEVAAVKRLTADRPTEEVLANLLS